MDAKVETIIDQKFERLQFLKDVKNVGCRWPCDNVARIGFSGKS